MSNNEELEIMRLQRSVRELTIEKDDLKTKLAQSHQELKRVKGNDWDANTEICSGCAALIEGSNPEDVKKKFDEHLKSCDKRLIPVDSVDAETLRQAQANPQEHRDLVVIRINPEDQERIQHPKPPPNEYRNLIVRVAGYSDYFCDLSRELQDEIIERTEQGTW